MTVTAVAADARQAHMTAREAGAPEWVRGILGRLAGSLEAGDIASAQSTVRGPRGYEAIPMAIQVAVLDLPV